ncbi:MAG: ATP-binding protein [Acidobacteria bacterium]|nr:ATP-binding protein [Acidobacteriota bacterium]MBV9067536.1 ATP-binding protein [Acidobacteriota bacterium]MBV9188829.1 ATP-binding protein [Acidobacteriota bacterium]
MPTGAQLKALLKSLEEGDDQRLYSVALQMAAHEAHLGHGKLATDLRKLIDSIRGKQRSVVEHQHRLPTPLAQPRGELAGLLSVTYPDVRLIDVILPKDLEKRVRRVLHEHRQDAKLRSHGLFPRSKLLLVGPPGSGKTMTARALAGELRVPLFSIMLDGLITKFMGETAAKLRLVFDAMRRTQGVYLFDEFDAIGGQRTFSNDVGEVRRILNSFLSLLEEMDPSSLVVAATNHPELLDRALSRRFDDVLDYDFPSIDLAKRALRGRFSTLDTSQVNWDAVASLSAGLSYAEIIKACDDAAKAAILADRDAIDTDQLRASIEERKRAKSQSAAG